MLADDRPQAGIRTMREAIDMITVELTEAEAATLRQCLETLLSDVRMEMCDTDRADFRDKLKVEKSTLEKVIGQLGLVTTSTST
jgi:hypothetical protein